MEIWTETDKYTRRPPREDEGRSWGDASIRWVQKELWFQRLKIITETCNYFCTNLIQVKKCPGLPANHQELGEGTATGSSSRP